MSTVADLASVTFERLRLLQDRLNVFEGKAPPSPGAKCAVYYPAAGSPYADRHGGGQGAFTWSFFVICAGSAPVQCLEVCEAVRDVLLGWRPDPSDAAGPLEEVNLGNDLIEDGGSYSFTLRYTLTTSRRSAPMPSPDGPVPYDFGTYGP